VQNLTYGCQHPAVTRTNLCAEKKKETTLKSDLSLFKDTAQKGV
jgi:hypothetical protein